MKENIKKILEERFDDLSNTTHYSNNGFELYVPQKGNTNEVGYFYVDSYNGHDSYAYDEVSTHTYYVLDGEGDFIINGKVEHKKAGEEITINPNEVFYYKGTMKLIEKISPNFVAEHFHKIQLVSYDEETITEGKVR